MRIPMLLPIPVVALFGLASCASGPEPPKAGTPAFFWNAAKSTHHSGDVVKTSGNLQQLINSDSEFLPRALPWAIVVSAGMAQGYAEAAEAYDLGAKANRPNPMPFRKESSRLRSLASAAALEFAENTHAMTTKDHGQMVTLAFENPPGSSVQPPAYRKIGAGALVQDSERDAFVEAMLQRGVLLSASRAAGSAEDFAKTAETLKNGDAQRPRPEFLFAAAKMLYDLTDLYGSAKLDQPNRLRILAEEALECLKGVPESKESKALTAKVQAALKKIKATT